MGCQHRTGTGKFLFSTSLKRLQRMLTRSFAAKVVVIQSPKTEVKTRLKLTGKHGILQNWVVGLTCDLLSHAKIRRMPFFKLCDRNYVLYTSTLPQMW